MSVPFFVGREGGGPYKKITIRARTEIACFFFSAALVMFSEEYDCFFQPCLKVMGSIKLNGFTFSKSKNQ